MDWLDVIDLHTTVWLPLLKNDLTGHDIIEFSKSLPKLRAALGCCVCNQLLRGSAMMAKECRQHFACRGCLGGEREKKNMCTKCEDWRTFAEENSLTSIVSTYRKFCYLFLTNEKIIVLLEVKHEVDPEFDTFKLIDLVQEGVKGLVRARKRKTPVVPQQNKGVVPIEVERKPKKVLAVDQPEGQTQTNPNVQLPNENNTVGVLLRKVQPDTPIHDKFVTLPRPTSLNESVFNDRTQVPASASTSLPVPVSLAAQIAMSIAQTSGQTSTSLVYAPKPAEVPKPGVSRCKSPPGQTVTVKIEVQTTPEKSTNNDGNMSPMVPAQDPLASPARESPVDQMRTGNTPTLTFSRSMVANAVTTSINTTSAMNHSVPSPQSFQATQPQMTSYKITQSPLMNSQQPLSQVIQIANPAGGLKNFAVRPQAAFRIAGLPGRPGIPVQIIGTAAAPTAGPSSGNGNERQTFIPNAQVVTSSASPGSGLKRRIIFTTATPHDLQKWPDTSKVIQLAAGDISRIASLANFRPGMISVQGQLPNVVSGIRTTAAIPNVRPMATSTVTQPLVRPMSSSATLVTSSQPNMASNTTLGTPQHSGFSFVRIPATATTPAPVGNLARPTGFIANPTTVTRQVPPTTNTATVASPVVLQTKRRLEGCKCGNATPTPGKLTCIGQRCACYADRSACSDCKCKGCKNPYVPGTAGKKVVQVSGPIIDSQSSHSVPMLTSSTVPGPSMTSMMPAPAASANSAQSNVPLTNTVVPNASFGTIQTGLVSSNGQPMPPFQFIPVRFAQQSGHTQYLQIAGPQGLQQMPIILSTGGTVQGGGSTGITIQGIPVSGLTQYHQVPMQQPRMTQPTLNTERNPQQE